MTRWSSARSSSLLVLLITCHLTAQYKVVPDVEHDPQKHVYFNEQTVAIVKFDEHHEILNCSVIEVYEKSEAVTLLSDLSETVSQPRQMTFHEMLELMQLCDEIDRLANPQITALGVDANYGSLQKDFTSILQGILPGTKWCGKGDVATTYFDVGSLANLDRCCRSHDLCPIKIRAQRTGYGLMNKMNISISHCDCDEIFYTCLKDQKHIMSRLIGYFFFNLAPIKCIEEVPVVERSPKHKKFRFADHKKLF